MGGGSSAQLAAQTMRAAQRPASHVKARCASYPRNDKIVRYPVSNDLVSWGVDFADYQPVEYNAPSVLSKPVWADTDPRTESGDAPKWNQVDGGVDRSSHMGPYDVVNKVPQNPIGRTGISGRGLLGRWGPNHAADPIVTRWKRDDAGEIIRNIETGLRRLQFIAIQRQDSGEWAIPGGMVDPGDSVSKTLKKEFEEEALNSLEASKEQQADIENQVQQCLHSGAEGMAGPGEMVSVTLKREFSEETMNSLEVSEEERKYIQQHVEDVFKHGAEVYRGYVDDPRNTDNAWMETVAFNFHDESGDSVGKFKLHAGDDAVGVKWTDIDSSLKLYASHKDFICKVAQMREAFW